ncbi:MAG: glutamine amidotransferase [Xanthobacteraceae bacterium]
MTRRICTVIEHLAIEHAGTFKPALEACDFQVASIPAAAVSERRHQIEQSDLLLVMGGPIGVYDAPEYPFLFTEMDILRKRVAADRPVIGICLGAQLLAAALDAKVYPGTVGVELGWAPLEVTRAGANHPISVAAADSAPVLHWHGDTFDLPTGAHLLASTEKYRHQAFSVRDRALALQFHIETDEAELEQWFVAFAGDIRKHGKECLSELRANTRKYAKDLARRNAEFVKVWIGQI